MMMEQKVKLSAKQPEGERNGLNQPDVMRAITEGFARGASHLAVVEFSVVEQAQGAEGVVTNRLVFDRIEVVNGVSATEAAELLEKAHAERLPDQLPGFGAENVEGRGNE